MYIVFLEEVICNIMFLAYRTDVTDSCSCGFFHDITKLACQKDLSLSRHHIHFNLKGIASNAGPCKSTYNTNLTLMVDVIYMEALFSKIVFQLILFYMHCGAVSSVNFSGCFSADRAQFSFQITHTGLSGVSIDNLVHCLVGNRKLFCLQTVFLFLFFQKMLFCDMHFFIFRITGYFNQLHTIQQWTWNRMYIVGCRDKQHFR